MEKHQKITRAEGVLLGLTGLFLCLLLVLFCRDRAALRAPAVPETLRPAPEEARPEAVDLNAAAEKELAALPGIGGVLARRIVEYRTVSGPFGTVEELTEVPGIGPGKLAALEGLVRVEDLE